MHYNTNNINVILIIKICLSHHVRVQDLLILPFLCISLICLRLPRLYVQQHLSIPPRSSGLRLHLQALVFWQCDQYLPACLPNVHPFWIFSRKQACLSSCFVSTHCSSVGNQNFAFIKINKCTNGLCLTSLFVYPTL